MYIRFRLSSDVCDERKFERFISISSLEMSRKSITLYDDQYKFFKAFNSPKLLIAFVEYMFDDKDPEWLNEQEQILFDSLRIRMDNQKKKSVAWSLSHWWWRPRKTTDDETKQQTKKQHKNNRKTTQKQEVEDISISRSISNTNNNISISNDIETDAKASEYWNSEINKCVNLIKQYNWWLLDWTQANSRKYSKLLIDKLNKLDSIKEWRYTRDETLEIILKVISQNKYHAPKITSPELIYRNLAILMQACKNDVWKYQSQNTILPTV